MVFLTKKDKLAAVVREIAARHKKGQPVLVGTASVEDSELLHQLLDVAGIEHRVLNAKQDGAEAAVVAMAGRLGAVTVATNMAGRGTDIMLGGNVEFIAASKMREEYGLDPDSTPEQYDEKYPEVLAAAREQVKAEQEKVSATSLGGSTTSCVGVLAGRVIQASPGSTCPWKMISCACSTRSLSPG